MAEQKSKTAITVMLIDEGSVQKLKALLMHPYLGFEGMKFNLLGSRETPNQ